VPFDPRLQAITGSAEAILKGTRPIRDHEVSPDGEWIAFTEAGVREDLFVARARGTEYRRLTDDGFRDRGPGWSPDASRIAFYSDRSGTYDLWMVRPDGSGLVPVTSKLGTPGFPVWSPDATSIAFGYERWHIVNPAVPSQTSPPAMPVISANEDYFPTSWSPAGDRLAGQIRSADGWTMSVGIYSLATQQFTRVPGDLVRTHQWVYPLWLADSRRLLVRRPDGIVLVDAETGAGRMLVTVAGDMIGHSVGLSRDNRWITYTETATEGDIWIGSVARTNAKMK
jgi:Tol biopolymer transport system component